MKSDGPTADEVHRVQIEQTRQQGMELDSVTRKASLLNHCAAAHGDPLAYRSVLDRILKVTPEDVRRVARAYLGPGRVELTVTPGPRPARRVPAEPLAAPSDPPVIARPAAHDDGFDRSITPDVGLPVAFDPPLIKRRRLSNGLELQIVRRHELPTVKMTLVIRSGATAAPHGKDGLSLLTVKLLEEGTKSRGYDLSTGKRADRKGRDRHHGGTDGLELDQPDHSDPATGTSTRSLRGRGPPSFVRRR